MKAEDYDFIARLVKEQSGLALPGDKHYLVESRLLPVAREAGVDDLSGLVRQMRRIDTGPALREAVVEAMTTNESFFFRDKLPFEYFSGVVMPYLLEARAAKRHIRIWCAAASTGQEPYSLAICLQEMGARVSGWRIEILGTDISLQALARAQAGCYTPFEVQRGLPPHLLAKYFVQKPERNGDTWEIVPAIRSMVTFQKFNLLDRFTALGTFDIVFCRNVLIYFDSRTKADVLERIARVMPPDGFMMLGAAETVVGLTDMFQPIPARRGLYSPAGNRSAPGLSSYVGNA
ncbi:chemotaxis protein methyltransferase CheR [Pseudochelatococcus lubricantis]|uniref:protein-glutamate O-methyltransferase n=1 Tax=Pseudochelatococcus lubricantis TaxID=1538102 RepID=A0ABX0UXK6_9HYPH|nr:protein-glutamate O-methyltransferase CheR [Pseudochelatococcus lubricantis]NIJ57133.1 chemotaxis protein methyltransferase CheR [Pseudochelatococcus lubricantis]